MYKYIEVSNVFLLNFYPPALWRKMSKDYLQVREA